MKKNNLALKITSLTGLLIGLLPGGFMIFEWIKMFVLKDAVYIENYHFGTEVMIENGGWIYKNVATYSWICFIEGAVLLGISYLFAWSFYKGNSWKVPIFGGIGFAIVYIISNVVRNLPL